MRPIVRALMVTGLVMALAQGAARADEVEGWVERPLTLRPGTVQPTLLLGITNISDNNQSSSGESVSAALDVGVTPMLQLGLYASFPVNPAAFGSVLANAQAALSDSAGLRLDLGLVRETANLGSLIQGSTNLFTFGIGAPIKLRLSRFVALTSGRPGAAAFGQPLAVAMGSSGVTLGANPMLYGDDVFGLVADDNGHVDYVAHLPIGLLLSPHERFAIGLRTGFRAVFPSRGEWTKMVPVGADAMVSLARNFDLGASFDVAGIVDDPNESYFDYRQISVWTQARF